MLEIYVLSNISVIGNVPDTLASIGVLRSPLILSGDNINFRINKRTSVTDMDPHKMCNASLSNRLPRDARLNATPDKGSGTLSIISFMRYHLYVPYNCVWDIITRNRIIYELGHKNVPLHTLGVRIYGSDYLIWHISRSKLYLLRYSLGQVY